MLVMILGASLFVTYFNDEPTTKGFMNSSIINPIIPTEELSPADGGNDLRSVIDRQIRVAVILWDEQRKGSDVGCPRELRDKTGFVNCGTDINEESVTQSNVAEIT